MSTHEHDRGLAAVARVRGVRERDSRLGLAAAVATVRERESLAAHRRELLAAAEAFDAGVGADFVAHQHTLTGLAEAVRDADAAVASARVVAASALAHWQQDKARLRAVELLLERRAQARKEERDRTESRELDDVAARLWLRRTREEATA